MKGKLNQAYRQIVVAAYKDGKINAAEELILLLPGAKWEPPDDAWAAAGAKGWVDIYFGHRQGYYQAGASGANALGQYITHQGWAARKKAAARLGINI